MKNLHNQLFRRTLLGATLGCCGFSALSQELDPVSRLTDPITGRSIRRYQSPHHETHHYYFISPWSPDEKQIVFFQFDRTVEQLTARGRFPGSLMLMNSDGGGRRTLVENLKGHYHVGVNQFWGPAGQHVYFMDNSGGPAVMTRVEVQSGKTERLNTPVNCGRLSPNGEVLSCGNALEWGLYDLKKETYQRLVTLERALALTPHKALVIGRASALQNTRFSPSGDKVMIVHRTTEDFPRLVEAFVYDLNTEQLMHVAADLHHPCWRPDGQAILFARWDNQRVMQNLWEVDLKTREERPVLDEHISAVHSSYHPQNSSLVLTDCYGGDFGNGLALVDLKARKARLLVSIPQGAGADKFPDERFPFRNWGLFFPPRKYLNEPRPVWNHDGTRVLYTSEESGRMNLYVVDTSDL